MHRISGWPDIPAFLSGYLAGRIIRPFLSSVRSEKQQALSGCLFILLWNINMQYLLWGKISCISGIRPDRKSGIYSFRAAVYPAKSVSGASHVLPSMKFTLFVHELLWLNVCWCCMVLVFCATYSYTFQQHYTQQIL